jgi:very-short-patch-repair endonuclease
MLRPITPTNAAHPYLKRFRKRMRRAPSSGEAALAKVLGRLKVGGRRLQYARQQVFHDADTRTSYIVDFWLRADGIVVEVDGSQHFDREAVEQDARRDAAFAGAGIETLRITYGQMPRAAKMVANAVRKRRASR